MGFFDSLKKAFGTTSTPSATSTKASSTQAAGKSPKKEENHRLAGTSYHQDAIKSLGTLNPDYKLNKAQLIKKGLIDVDVYEYNFRTCKADLVPEPTNEYDPNAIKVLISGKHVGYIKKGSCSHVKKLMNASSIKSITATIKGGNSKYVFCCDDVGDRSSYEYESSKGTIGVEITIRTI